MRSLERTPLAGLYRSACCGTEMALRRESVLPLCPSCRRPTRWAVVVSSEPHPAPRRARRFDFLRAESEAL
jgi:hypothetical protein